MASPPYSVFYVDKGLNPFSSLLTLFGLAKVISAILREPSDDAFQITLKEEYTAYVLRCSPAITDEMLEQRITPQRAIQTPKTKLPQSMAVYDYETEKGVVTAYFEARKKGVDAEHPRAYWDVLRAINPAALPGYNSLMLNWDRVTGNADVVRLLFDLFSSTPNDVNAAISTWKQLDKVKGWGIDAHSTAQQLYNPDSGKGQNRTKANGLSIGNVDNFWLLEWLKAVGFYDAGLTRLMRGSKDRKTLIIAPRELTYRGHQAVMNKFVGTMQVGESSTRFDILAVIRYVSALLVHLEEDDLSTLLSAQNVKKRLVSGFYTAFYKYMGNAVATMNMSFIAMPGWINLQSSNDIALYRELLDELGKFVRQFDESHSDAFTLLQHLRDFISGDDLRAFFRFTNAFPPYLMGMRERNKPAKQLTVEFIERLIMSSENAKPLSPILQSEGFRNIAYAIRQSTVTAQYQKKLGNRKYDVRYGLGQDLSRKARYPHDFISALSDFLHKYNAENAQIMETRSGPYRRSIKMSDIDEIVQLIDDYGSETIGNLLIAYGYARVDRDTQDDNDLPEPTDEEMENE